jgi:GntR family transcriptional repressor for pyruvate dehydrogenase complex
MVRPLSQPTVPTSAPANTASQLRPVETRRLYQQIADQIRDLIQRGVFKPGSKLPPERDLAQQLGVSRPSLREALIALDIEQSVEIRSGSGVYVCNPPERPARATEAMGESPSELMQARAAVEGDVAVLACAHVSSEALSRLRESIEGMRAQIAQWLSPLGHDRQFHLTLAEMSGNSVMVRLVAELFDERHSPISSHLSVRFENTRTWNTALKEHEAIYRALEARDPLSAQAAMRSHLKASEERWVGG